MPEGFAASVMSLELEHECPECGETRTFWKVASMEVHLGTKMKWDCPECDFGFVQVDGEVDSSAA
jgi:rubredoxin